MEIEETEVLASLGEMEQVEKEMALADYELREFSFIPVTYVDADRILSVKEQLKRYESLYEKRDAVAAKLPQFWPRVV